LVCAAVAATTAWHLYPWLPLSKYTAQALLYIEANPPTILHRAGEIRTDFATYRQTQAGWIKSRDLLNRALNKDEVSELEVVRSQLDPAEWLEKEIKVDYPGPEFLRISMSGNKPDELRLLVESVTKVYWDERVDKEHHIKRKQLEQVKEFVTTYENKLKEKRQTFRKLAEAAGSSDAHTLALKQRFAQERLALSEKELLQLTSELRKLRIELGVQRAKGGANVDSNERQAAGAAGLIGSLAGGAIPGIGMVGPSREIGSNPESAMDEYMRKDPTMARQLDAKEELEKLLKWALQISAKGESDPMVNRYRKDLKSADAELAATRQQLRPVVIKALEQKARGQLQADIARIQERITLTEVLEQTLKVEVDRLHNETRSLNTSTLDVEGFKQDISELEAVVKELKSKETTLTLELEVPSRITRVGETNVSHPDEFRRRIIATALAGFFGLGLVSFIFAWREFRCQRVSSVDEVVNGLGGMKLVGTMPVLPRAKWNRLVGPPALQELVSPGLFADSADAARTVLLHAARQDALRVVMVTSAMAGEGKTSVASQLAVSLARAGSKTLLIDGDLRNPAVHRLFDVPRLPGLAELLRGEIASTEVIRSTLSTHLWLVPAGRYDDATIQILAREGIRHILDGFKGQYDFILIDSPPVLPVPDSLLIGQGVDAVILSVLQEVTRMPAVYAAYQRLAMLGIRTLGMVVNGTRDAAYSSSYYYRTPPASKEDTNA
jgi:capsular exopolysaccharide synthesis family protein